MSENRVNAAIIGPGNIGTDLMYKILKRSKFMNLRIIVGIYADSEGDTVLRYPDGYVKVIKRKRSKRK